MNGRESPSSLESFLFVSWGDRDKERARAPICWSTPSKATNDEERARTHLGSPTWTAGTQLPELALWSCFSRSGLAGVWTTESKPRTEASYSIRKTSQCTYQAKCPFPHILPYGRISMDKCRKNDGKQFSKHHR